MKTPFVLLSVALSTTLLIGSAQAGPGGAGSCPKGMPAVGLSHLRENATTGSLADGGLTFTIGNTTMTTGETFDAGVNEEWTFNVAASALPFKGILVRLECLTNLTGAITSDDPLLHDAAVCDTTPGDFVVGLTHNSRDEKDSVDMTVALGVATTVSVDITVVMYNNDTGSAYYYDQFFFATTHPPCDICGTLGPLGDPMANVTVPPNLSILPLLEGISEVNCGVANQVGLAGQIPAVRYMYIYVYSMCIYREKLHSLLFFSCNALTFSGPLSGNTLFGRNGLQVRTDDGTYGYAHRRSRHAHDWSAHDNARRGGPYSFDGGRDQVYYHLGGLLRLGRPPRTFRVTSLCFGLVGEEKRERLERKI